MGIERIPFGFGNQPRGQEGNLTAVPKSTSFFARLLVAVILGSFLMTAAASRVANASRDHKSFAALSARLSEPGGYFDSDNLISNETSYLHVIGKLKELGVNGGVYLGVGPDQSFSYIAKIRPKLAIMIDIRRDNLLQHLLFKSMFARSRNRIEYLCMFFGKPMPKTKGWEWSGCRRSMFQTSSFTFSVKARSTDLSRTSRRCRSIIAA
jgi:hypothetical protein